MMDENIKNNLIKAYRRAHYEVKVGDGLIVIKVEDLSPHLDGLLKERGLAHWALITAYNPRSELKSPEENEKANLQLKESLGVYSICWESESGDVEGLWPVEKGFLIANCNEEKALEWGRLFGQNAILVGTIGEKAKLSWC